jgi:hypothetical protein
MKVQRFKSSKVQKFPVAAKAQTTNDKQQTSNFKPNTSNLKPQTLPP